MSVLRFLKLFSGDQTKVMNVDNANTARTTSTVVGAVQPIDATGKVPPAGDAVGNAPFVKITDGTDTVDVISANGEKGLVTVTPGCISSGNSSTSILGIGAVFTGTSDEIINHGVVVISVYSDVASATDGLSVQFSSDNTNWDIIDTFTIPAATGKIFSFQCAARYLRVVYTNGGTGQAEFRLQTILKPYYVKPSSHRIADTISDQDDAELVKSVLTAENDTGFVNIQATDSNNLRVTDAENGLAIAKGDVTKTSFIHKFGFAPDFDTGDSPVTLWEGANDGGINQMDYNYSSTADIDTISSSNAGDTQTLEILGLDTSYDLVTLTPTLNGQNKVTLATSLLRIYRMKNTGSTDLAGIAYCYVDGGITAGVPNDLTTVRALIDNGNNQTLMAIYTIPNGYKGYMRDWFVSTAGASRSADYVVDLIAKPFGQVFQIKQKVSIQDGGTTYFQHKFEEPEVFEAKTDIEIHVTIETTGVTQAAISGGFDIVLVQD